MNNSNEISHFGHQFFISNYDLNLPDTYEVRRIAEKRIYFDKRFKCIPLQNKSSHTTGYIIGYPYHEKLKEFIQEHHLIESIDYFRVDGLSDIENNLIPLLAGSYILVTFGELPLNLYPDHIASIPIFFDIGSNEVASSVALILNDDEYEARFDSTLHRIMVTQEGIGGWIPGKLTAHKNIVRVLPNHFLDLLSGKITRYWPKHFSIDDFIPFKAAVSAIAESIQGFTEGALTQLNASQTLTAGFDTRLLLAASRRLKDKASYFTLQAEKNKIDVDIASAISKEFKFTHRIYPLIKSSEADKAIWDRMVGNSVLEVNREIYKSLTQLNESSFIITGPCGALGRCFYYKNETETINETSLSAADLYLRFRIPQSTIVQDDFRCWFNSLPDIPNSAKLDLAYLELRGASWGMGQNTIQNSLKFNLLPFFSRPIISSFIMTNPSEKKDGALFRETINLLWPELLRFKINKYGNIKDYGVIIQKILTPGRLRRYIRSKF